MEEKRLGRERLENVEDSREIAQGAFVCFVYD